MARKNIALQVSYKGSNYYGFQRQKDRPSIQEYLEIALSKNLDEDIKIISSGRTDAGVHAKCQTVNFYTSTSISIEKIPRLINYDLPKDISIRTARQMPMDFHSRKSAKSRHYRYLIYNDPQPSGLLYEFSWHVYGNLNIDKMAKTAKILEGVYDFSAFVGQGSNHSSPYRNIYSIEINKKENIIEIDIIGSSFLKNMCRIMVGSIVDVGRAKKDIDDIKRALQSGVREDAGLTAPAKGLILMEVKY